MNKKNDKNKNIAATEMNATGISELDASFLDAIGGGVGDVSSGPIVII